MKNNIKLSVIIISYKQAKYIREAIDSVLMQKVNFRYELLLADDYSQDGTLEIMKEYEKKHPDIVRVLERAKNLGATQNVLDAWDHCSGKYVTVLEGDDYWCNENKIQMQVDFLDNNDDYVAMAHLQDAVDINGVSHGYIPDWIKKDCDITINDYLHNKPFSVSTSVYRNLILNKQCRDEVEKLYSFSSSVGDSQKCVYLLSKGQVKVIAQPLMVYRYRSNEGETNYNSTHSIDEIEMEMMDIYLKLEDFFEHKYNFYYKYLKSATVGYFYCLLKLKFKKAHKFIKKCPRRYRLRIRLAMPFVAVKIFLKKLFKK